MARKAKKTRRKAGRKTTRRKMGGARKAKTTRKKRGRRKAKKAA